MPVTREGGPAPASPPEPSSRGERGSWAAGDTIAIVSLTLLAAIIRLVRLAEPAAVVFDETYYAKDACLYVGFDQELCASPHPTEQSYVHPPLGKWLIATGIKVFGYNTFGWRISAAIVGTALVPVVFLLARKLFRDRWTASAAGFLAATEFLLIVQSRIAMLDIFLAFFVTTGFLLLAYDRERLFAIRDHLRLPFPGEPPPRYPEWRLAAGALFGMAAAVKWSAIWGLAAGALLVAWWSIGVLRLQKKVGNVVVSSRSEFATLFLGFAVIPLFLYLLSYGLWFSDRYENRGIDSLRGFTCRESRPSTGDDFVELQLRMYCYHIGLEAEHSYQSKAWTWPLVLRPTAYYYEGEPQSHHILAFGNPLVWYPALAAGLWLVYRSLRHGRPERLVLVAWGAQYFPWVFVNRPLFFFYMTPVVPFMMIALAAGLGALRSGRASRRLVFVYLVLAGGVALWYFYPVIAAVGLPYEQWRSRMWFGSRWI